MTLLNQIKILCGAEVCEHCGSGNIIKRGFENWNERFECRDCGKETRVTQS